MYQSRQKSAGLYFTILAVKIFVTETLDS